VIRKWNCDQGGKMKHCITAFHGFFYSMGISNVTWDDFKLPSNIFSALIKPTPRIEGVVANKSADFITLANKSFSKVRAYESISAGHEDACASLY
jgi:hypothetical protein